MEESGARELVAVLGITALLFIAGVVAVVLFIRQYRRERKKR